jgi:hypothetical protein
MAMDSPAVAFCAQSARKAVPGSSPAAAKAAPQKKEMKRLQIVR